MNVVEIKDVSRSFGSVRAVDGLTLSLGEGETVGFLGVNGAGKTTTVKMMLGLIRPDSGRVSVMGGDPTDPEVRRAVGYMPEIAYYYPYLNARELLAFYGGLSGMSRGEVRARSAELLEAVGLADAAKRPLKTYSKGMLQRVGIAQALLSDPAILILDEPFTGLDPLARIQLRELFRSLRDKGKTVFFSSHELGETELICDRVAIMKQGRCIYQGPARQIAGGGEGNLERLFLEVLEKGGAK